MSRGAWSVRAIRAFETVFRVNGKGLTWYAPTFGTVEIVPVLLGAL